MSPMKQNLLPVYVGVILCVGGKDPEWGCSGNEGPMQGGSWALDQILDQPHLKSSLDVKNQ